MLFLYMPTDGKKQNHGADILLHVLDQIPEAELQQAEKAVVITFDKDNRPSCSYYNMDYGDTLSAASTLQIDCVDMMIRANRDRYGIREDDDETED